MSEVTSGSAVAESPASTPAVADAAPSSAPSSPAENTPPASFADAWVRAGDAATPDPVSPTPPADTADAPTIAAPAPEPVETVTAAPEKDKKGPIPYDRHEAALKNARDKASQEIEHKFRETHKDSLKFGEAFERDPVATTGKLIATLAQHPEFGPKIVAEAARLLSTRAKQPTAVDEEPQPDFQTPDGATFYSAAAQAKREAWLVQKITNEVKQSLIDPLHQKVEPLVSREQQRELTERQTAREQAVYGEMKELYGDYEGEPYFKEHKKEIGARTLALMKEGKTPERAIAKAYREVLLSKGVADRQQQLTAQAVAKATGSTVQPGSVASAPAKRPTSFREAFAGISD